MKEAICSLFSMNILRMRFVRRCCHDKILPRKGTPFFYKYIVLCYIEKKVISNRMPKDLEKKYRAQKYRREWEKEHWARGWLSSSKNHPGKAYCYVCNKDLAAGKSELIGHKQSSSHIRLIKTVEEIAPWLHS